MTAAKAATSCPHFDVEADPKLLLHYRNLFLTLKYQLHLTKLQGEGKLPNGSNNELLKPTIEFECGKCKVEADKFGGPFYVCLQCPQMGCWRPLGQFHLRDHLIQSLDHQTALEIKSGLVYCSACQVFIWNSLMNTVLASPAAINNLSPIGKGEKPKSGKANSSSPSKPSKKKSEAELTEDEISKHCVTLRGLVNLGNTCFMSSVLQILLHTQLLRDYFLSGKHNNKNLSCASPKGNPESHNNIEVCMACELDELFCQIYSGERKPFAPHRFLYGSWRSAKHLAGYEQQDAHEFMISLLNQLHGDLGGSNFACKCPVHQAFTGVLQSDVTCLSCGTVNPSFDPFMDISLDILTAANDSNFVFDPNTGNLTLRDCFQLFTHAERLSANTYMCAKCNHTYQEATKQLSIRKAPPVLIIHLKRFEHSLNTVKIDTFVHFPLEFSIFDYTTEGVHLAKDLDLENPKTRPSNYNSKKYSPEMMYRLVGTINHSGMVDSGHYIAYAASEDREFWFKFDDATVTKVPRSTVLNSNPYMLFYECALVDRSSSIVEV